MSTPPAQLPDRVACYRHADRLTGARCTRCGRPICPDCMLEAPVGHQCPNCVREGGREAAPVRWNPARRPGGFTPVVKALVVVNVVVFLLTASNRVWQADFDLFPLAVASGQPYRLLTAAFLHANIPHILFNMVALVLLGPPVEEALGRRRFLALYLLSALGGAVCSYFLGPVALPSVGASGAIFGLFGAWFSIARAQRSETSGIVVLIAIQLVYSFVDKTVDWRAHVGGLVTGIVVGGIFALAARRPPAQRRAIEIGISLVTLATLLLLARVRTNQINLQAALSLLGAKGVA
jgi:membrane associated rhomboid family serine protease